MQNRANAATAVWLLAATYYFYQYVLRAAPAVMMPQLSQAFELSAVGVATLAGVFYYGYGPFSLIAGTALDRFGARAAIPAGALLAGLGALLFGAGNVTAAAIGRFLQGAGGVFALIGAVYIASNSFPPSRVATLVGITQMFGSSGGSAGQFLVGPMIAAGVAWSAFWIGMGVAGLLIAGILFVLLPKQSIEQRNDDWIRGSAASLAVVFRNPQTLLCGLVAGLLFIPTTIFDMIWGVRFLEEGRGFDYGDAVIRSATVPLGWLIGSPLLGLLSDRLGRRKPVIVGGGTVLFACLAWILYGPGDVLPPYVLGLVAGVASGGAMLTYTICKESNPPHLSGTATGVISFLNFTFSALVQPLLGWVMANVSVAHLSPLERYQTTFGLLLYGVALAVVLALVLRETGPGARVAVVTAEAV